MYMYCIYLMTKVHSAVWVSGWFQHWGSFVFAEGGLTSVRSPLSFRYDRVAWVASLYGHSWNQRSKFQTLHPSEIHSTFLHHSFIPFWEFSVSYESPLSPGNGHNFGDGNWRTNSTPWGLCQSRGISASLSRVSVSNSSCTGSLLWTP